MEQSIVLIYALLTYMIVNKFYCRILTPHDRIKHPQIAIFSLQAAALIIYGSIYGFTVSASFSILVNSLLLVCCILFFQGKLLLRLCAFFIVCFILTLAEIASAAPFMAINLFFPEKNLLPKMLIQDGPVVLAALMFLLDLLLLIFVFSKLGGLLENCFLFLRPSLLLRLGGPLAVLLFLQNGLFAFAAIKDYLLYSLLYWTAVIICLVVLNSALKKLENQESYNIQLKMHEKLIAFQLEHFQKAADEYQATRKWNHDISNHLLSLSYLIKQEQTDEAVKYIDSIFDAYGLEKDKK